MPDARPSVSAPVAVGAGRLLGLDYGERRIGVAVADPSTGAIRALTTLAHRDATQDATAIAHLAAEHRVAEVIVGLPLRVDGTDGTQAIATRAWAAAIAAELTLPVRLRDERYSSLAAEARLPKARRGSAGGPPSSLALRAHRARIDREAAAGILQAELDARREIDA